MKLSRSISPFPRNYVIISSKIGRRPTLFAVFNRLTQIYYNSYLAARLRGIILRPSMNFNSGALAREARAPEHYE